jgi:hypothetical protein
MINISERPAEAEDRAIPGHWEGDLIIGAGGGSAIGTLVERSTGFVMLLHLPGDRTAATLAEAMSVKIPDIPEVLRRSLTWDQGKQMALHTAITEATGLPISFCDPHSPWQPTTRKLVDQVTHLHAYGDPAWIDNSSRCLQKSVLKLHHIDRRARRQGDFQFACRHITRL